VRFLPLAALLLLAACGQQTAPTASAIDPTEPVSPTVQTTSVVTEPASPSPTPSLTPTGVTSTPTATTAPVAERPAGLRGMLLTDSELGTGWRSNSTRAEGEDRTGSCQVTPLTTIGALSSLRRTYVVGEDTAVQVVAKFADSKSAWRSFEVLKSWRSKCASRVPAGSTVSALTTLNAAPAVAHRYEVRQPGVSERVGLVRRGEYISVVVFAVDAATDYPAGQEPESHAVRRIAQLLG